MHTRDSVIETLKPFLIEHPQVLVAWEGGSAANDAIDAYSDLDVMIVAEEGDTDTLFAEIETCLREHFGIREAMRLPEPAWHGFAQTFYALRDTEPWFYVDLCILPPKPEDPFTASDRHGNVVIWKDTLGFIDHRPTPREIVEKRARTFYVRATQDTFVLRAEVDKALRRNRYLDAYHFMYAFIMRCLIPLMNIEHRIEKVDFGMRYAERDYAAEDSDLLLRFFAVSNLEALKNLAEEIFSRYEHLKKAQPFK